MKRTAILAAVAMFALSAGFAQAADKVTLQLKWVTQAQFAGYYVAADQGFYAEEDLEVEIKAGGPDIAPPQVLYTSDGVLLEMLAHFSRASRSFRRQLVDYIRDIRADPAYRVVPHQPALMEAALDLYAGEFADSSFSLQDCVAVVIMREYGITSILTADQEFARAGFTPLLRRYLD